MTIALEPINTTLAGSLVLPSTPFSAVVDQRGTTVLGNFLYPIIREGIFSG